MHKLTSIVAHKASVFCAMSMPQNKVEIALQLMTCWFSGRLAKSLCLETHLLPSMKSKLIKLEISSQALFLQRDMFEPWQRAQQLFPPCCSVTRRKFASVQVFVHTPLQHQPDAPGGPDSLPLPQGSHGAENLTQSRCLAHPS